MTRVPFRPRSGLLEVRSGSASRARRWRGSPAAVRPSARPVTSRLCVPPAPMAVPPSPPRSVSPPPPGIAILATGGIGGVHRGWARSHDVSADVVELGRRGVAVVCAGAKALLDLPATLEALETEGVAVVGFGCSEFPAFYSADSGLALAHAVDDVDGLKHLLSAQRALSLTSGVVICQPPPAAAALPGREVETLVEEALAEAAARGVGGRRPHPLRVGGARSPFGRANRALQPRAPRGQRAPRRPRGRGPRGQSLNSRRHLNQRRSRISSMPSISDSTTIRTKVHTISPAVSNSWIGEHHLGSDAGARGQRLGEHGYAAGKAEAEAQRREDERRRRRHDEQSQHAPGRWPQRLGHLIELEGDRADPVVGIQGRDRGR